MNDDLNKQEVDAYLTVLLPSLLIPRFAVHLVVPDGYQMQIGYYPSSPQKMFEIYKLEKKPGEGISIHSSAADINLVYESSGQHFNEKRKNAFSMHFPLSSMKIDAAKTPHRTTLDQCGVYLIDTNKVEDSPKRVRKMAAFGDLEKMQAGLNKCGKIISANNTKIFMGMLTKLAALERTAKQLSEEVAELKKERNQTNFPALPEAAKEKPSSQKDHRKE